MEPVTLRSRRLVLDSPVVADIDRIASICQDAEIQLWTMIPSPWRRPHTVLSPPKSWLEDGVG